MFIRTGQRAGRFRTEEGAERCRIRNLPPKLIERAKERSGDDRPRRRRPDGHRHRRPGRADAGHPDRRHLRGRGRRRPSTRRCSPAMTGADIVEANVARGDRPRHRGRQDRGDRGPRRRSPPPAASTSSSTPPAIPISARCLRSHAMQQRQAHRHAQCRGRHHHRPLPQGRGAQGRRRLHRRGRRRAGLHAGDHRLRPEPRLHHRRRRQGQEQPAEVRRHAGRLREGSGASAT